MDINKKEPNKFIGYAICAVAILFMIYFVIEHTYKNSNKKAIIEKKDTLIQSESADTWTIQSFPEYQLEVKCPTVLKDVSSKSNDDFDFNYAGNTDDAFYQVMIIRVPAGRKDMTKEQYKEFLKESFGRQGGGKHVLWGEEGLPAYLLDDYTQEGLNGRGIAVAYNGLIYVFNIMAKENLSFIFNRFTNNVKLLSHSTNVREEEPNPITMVKMNTYTKSGIGSFSISYPYNWKLVENPNSTVCVYISAPLGDYKQSPANFNVIISKDTASLENKFKATQAQLREHVDNYRLYEYSRNESY